MFYRSLNISSISLVVERRAYDAKAAGSNPVWSIIGFIINIFNYIKYIEKKYYIYMWEASVVL